MTGSAIKMRQNMKQATQNTTSATRSAQQRQSYANYVNSRFAGRYILEVIHNDEYQHEDDETPYSVTYGFKEISFWYPAHQHWIQADASKFQVTAPTFELAKSEFWARFNNYCVKRFGTQIYMESAYYGERTDNSNHPSFNRDTRRTSQYAA